ncbi:NAD(P)H-binding protein [Alloscardovia macacae]|uniref:Oxidoreductase n=1 Tax=Alloscardovia macacae TaxID=1160091 RepID=A0A261F5J3_9BIFI|nr:NAD(P)H-binding protein [Alloscardovia macacae]OZG54409.1 oxidoreductase [Alloscardovia macacae]
MTNVTIIGATGSLGRVVTRALLKKTDAHLTLFSRTALSLVANLRVTRMSASTDNASALEDAVRDADVVFVALSGDLPFMAGQVVAAMNRVGARRIVFVSAYGIYGEVADERDGRQSRDVRGSESPGIPDILLPYLRAADIIESSGLDYTILRPGWFKDSADGEPGHYQLIPKGRLVHGHDVARESIADVVCRVVENPYELSGENVAIIDVQE